MGAIRLAVARPLVAAQPAKAPILWTADWSPDGRHLAVGGDDGDLRLFSPRLELLKTYELGAAVQCVDWDRDGRLLAVALDDRPVRVLDVVTGRMQELDDSAAGSRALAWSPDGRSLAVGDYEGVLRIRDRAGRLLRSIPKDNGKAYLAVDWHPTKELVVTGSDRIRVFDAAAGRQTAGFRHREEETIVLTVRWHPGGSFFASGDYGSGEEGVESLLQFWGGDGTPLRSMRGSRAEYRNVRWSGDGERLATASDALRVWAKDGRLLHTGASPDLLWGLDWDARGGSLASSSKAGEVRLWTAEAVPVATAR